MQPTSRHQLNIVRPGTQKRSPCYLLIWDPDQYNDVCPQWTDDLQIIMELFHLEQFGTIEMQEDGYYSTGHSTFLACQAQLNHPSPIPQKLTHLARFHVRNRSGFDLYQLPFSTPDHVWMADQAEYGPDDHITVTSVPPPIVYHSQQEKELFQQRVAEGICWPGWEKVPHTPPVGQSPSK